MTRAIYDIYGGCKKKMRLIGLLLLINLLVGCEHWFDCSKYEYRVTTEYDQGVRYRTQFKGPYTLGWTLFQRDPGYHRTKESAWQYIEDFKARCQE